MTTNLTREFAELLLAWPADDAALLERCRLLVTDGIAVAVAGAHETGPVLMGRLARTESDAGTATVIGQGLRTHAAAAARVNGMSMHVLDFEPMWFPPNHAMSPLLPALLALAEQRETDSGEPHGPAVLRSLAKGIEAQGRLRLSSAQLEPAQLSLHPPGVVGPIACALACADLLALDIGQATHAAGIAASRSSALLANVGSHTKALHCGDAAAHGLEAALLAASGFTANDDALNGPRGWGHAYFGAAFDAQALLMPIGRGRALEPGPSWKLFPSQFATHFGITAGLQAHARIGQATISHVRLRVPSMPYIDRPTPATGLEGKFSWQYTTAAALLDGKVEPATFTDARRHAADVHALLERFELLADPSISGSFDQMNVELTVSLSDGRTIDTRCDTPLGSWRRPVSPSLIEAKARGLLEAHLGADRSATVLAALAPDTGVISVRALMALLA